MDYYCVKNKIKNKMEYLVLHIVYVTIIIITPYEYYIMTITIKITKILYNKNHYIMNTCSLTICKQTKYLIKIITIFFCILVM